jgi:hypothetical protein
MYNNFPPNDIRQEISKKYLSIIEKSIKIFLEHGNNPTIRQALGVVAGSSSIIITLSKISVPVNHNQVNLFSNLGINVSFTPVNTTQPIVYNTPIIDLNFAYNFLNRSDNLLENGDNLLQLAQMIENDFTQHRIDKNW